MNMMMRSAVLIVALGVVAGISPAAARAGEPAKATSEAVILDLNDATYRVFYGWKTPTLIAPDGTLKPVLERKRSNLNEADRKPAPKLASAAPASNWMAPEFNDGAWPKLEVNAPAWRPKLLWAALHPRSHVDKYLPGNALEGNRVCLRGTFEVSDPAQVKDLKVRLGYFGGAVVYVNGAEVARGHLPPGALTCDTLATRYSDEAYLATNNMIRSYAGNWIFGYWGDVRIHTNMLNSLKVWRREIPAAGATGGLAIPSAMLRKGVNVLAVAVHAAPVNELYYEKSVGSVTWVGDNNQPWPHAMIVDAQLTASSHAGFGPVADAAGIGVVNAQVMETLVGREILSPSVQIHPIRIVGTRNGTFSGQVGLRSDGSISNLQASVSDLLKAEGGVRLPASSIQVRWSAPAVSDDLCPDFPATFAAIPVGNRKQAVASVWVTATVPAGQPAGEYRGTLKVEASGVARASLAIPVHLKVNEWRMPDPMGFAIHHNIYQSPETLARYYGVPLWSERHFELAGKSLSAFKALGNRLCVVNLLLDSYTLGNSQGMVQWVRKPDGGYTYDFSIADRYMDLYEKTSGKPGVLRLDAWQRVSDARGKQGQQVQLVTVRDPITGKLESLAQPPYGTPENEAFWRPVLTELRQRLEKRGWFDVAAFGWVHYSKPADPAMVDVFHRIWPDGKWMHTAHTFPSSYGGTAKGISMPVLCSEGVWGVGALYDPDGLMDRQGGYQEQGVPHYPRRWKNGPKNVFLGFPRMGVSFVDALRDHSPLAVYRTVTEATVQGNICGLGYLGGDFWPVPEPGGKEGRRTRVSWGGQGICMTDACTALVSPGPDGARFNQRTEAFREGVQVAEAILYLGRMQGEKKIPIELEKRMARLLDERARYYLRAWGNYRAFECSPWQERDDQLFALCGEVARANGPQ